jgi:hypothetical protein
MKTAIAPNVQPDSYDGETSPALVPDMPDGARDATDARPFDPTQGRKIGSEPYDDPTQGRQIGSDPSDDPTQGRKVGADAYDDPTQGRKIGADPHDDPTQGQKSDLIPTTTQPEAGSTGRRHLEAVSLIDIAHPGPGGPNRRSNG